MAFDVAGTCLGYHVIYEGEGRFGSETDLKNSRMMLKGEVFLPEHSERFSSRYLMTEIKTCPLLHCKHAALSHVKTLDDHGLCAACSSQT